MAAKKSKKRKKTLGDVISTMLLIICTCVFLYAAYRLVMIYLAYKTGVDEYDALTGYFTTEKIIRNSDGTDYEGEDEEEDTIPIFSETEEDMDEEDQNQGEKHHSSLPAMENPVDFESLCNINEDVVGWLEMEAIPGISYPMVQGEDNDYYLHRTFQRTDNFAGSIFVDFVNSRKFTDRNTIVYGHNMKNGSMFGSLKGYRTAETFAESPYFWIYTPDFIFRYEIFAYAEVSVESDAYQVSFNTDEDFLEYLYDRKDQSEVKTDVEVTGKDHVVTLSTCTGNEATRFIVQGKMVKAFRSIPKADGYNNEFQN